MWHSGLRGGVSLVLVMELGDWVDGLEGPGKKAEMINGTFILVVLYLLCFGSTTGFFLNLLGIPSGDEVPDGRTLYTKSDKSGVTWRFLKLLRRRFVHPILVGPKPEKPKREENTLGRVIRGAENTARTCDGQKHASHRMKTSSTFGSFTFTRAGLSSMWQLFGSTDPVHMNAYEDI